MRCIMTPEDHVHTASPKHGLEYPRTPVIRTHHKHHHDIQPAVQPAALVQELPAQVPAGSDAELKRGV